ncbi:PEPxxWA-CTERM sorting domain-containing protein [Sphingomonas glaciei]|uniref:PEPxxWA-CTERM sorting domain-containing protein n=1 Tax=Sphingomonas glaciei TaxID=2938948 RepID=A0ABY5MWG5_9SPHN|nr:PEPxxWA-CTERM sorting domain-containing protein [Sphingomonas glaciei]UUR07682.1 PEPxxWA-CTERM sorting domain-containing protein [Sphingomonas glaciei]
MFRGALGIALALGLASPLDAQSIYYQQGFTNNLYLYDAGTNTNTLIGDLGLSADSTGMAFSPTGTLYLYERASTSLYTVNPTTAATTLIGNTGIGAEDLTISLDGTTGYVTAQGNLYSINLSTGASTLLGSIGATLDGLTTAPIAVTIGGINYSAGTIFGVDSGTLFMLNVLTPSSSTIGSTTGASETLDFASDGTLWGQNNGTFNVINSSTFASIPDGASAGGNFAFGMAIAPSISAAVPEPSTWAMMLIGFGAIGASMRRRRTVSALAQMG